MHQVRAAKSTDAAAIQRFFERVIREAEWLPDSARSETDFVASSPGESVFVCYAANGELAGLLAVYVPEAFIHHLYVAPEHQRQGVGTALLGSLASWLPLPWRLKCVRANRSAQAFYQSVGWRQIGTGNSDQGPYLLLEKPADAPPC